MYKIELQPAYILHSRPYRETSLLVEFFTPQEGRFTAVAKGVRRQKSIARAILQPFVPLLISCVGKGELLTLKHFEAMGKPHTLSGNRLLSGFYMNELLMRLLQRFDAHEELFHMYSKTLSALTEEKIAVKAEKETGNNIEDETADKAADKTVASTEEETVENTEKTLSGIANIHEQIVLRLFEKTLLRTIGYELRLTMIAEENIPVSAEAWYLFDPERGPLLTSQNASIPAFNTNSASSISSSSSSLSSFTSSRSQHKANLRMYSGKSLLALANEMLDDPQVLRDAKVLMREALRCRLGVRPLETRRLF